MVLYRDNDWSDIRAKYSWVHRDGCDCQPHNCFWWGHCRGQSWPHWIEVLKVPNDN